MALETTTINTKAAQHGAPPIEDVELEEPVYAPLPDLQVDPARVVKDVAGGATTKWFVRLPQGAVTDDVRRPDFWFKVQNANKGFRKFDEVVCVTFNEDVRIEGFVESADGKGIVLTVLKVSELKRRYDPMLETEKHRITWVGYGYAVQRKSDGAVLGRPEASPQLAEKLLRQFEPVRVR